jgi:hypothetical protein
MNLEVHNRTNKSQSLVAVLRQTNPVPVHVLQSYFFKVYFSIILPSTPRSSKWSLLQVFLLKRKIHFVPPHTCHIPLPSYYPWFYRPKYVLLGVLATKLLTTQFSPVSCCSLPQHPILQYPQTVFRPSSVQSACTCLNPRFQHTPTKTLATEALCYPDIWFTIASPCRVQILYTGKQEFEKINWTTTQAHRPYVTGPLKADDENKVCCELWPPARQDLIFETLRWENSNA